MINVYLLLDCYSDVIPSEQSLDLIFMLPRKIYSDLRVLRWAPRTNELGISATRDAQLIFTSNLRIFVLFFLFEFFF